MVKSAGHLDFSKDNLPDHLKKMCAKKDISCSPDVGLNAEWNCSAYQLGPGIPNRTSGAYYVVDDEENNKLVLYQRRYMDDPDYTGDGYNDELIEIAVEEGRTKQSLIDILNSYLACVKK